MCKQQEKYGDNRGPEPGTTQGGSVGGPRWGSPGLQRDGRGRGQSLLDSLNVVLSLCSFLPSFFLSLSLLNLFLVFIHLICCVILLCHSLFFLLPFLSFFTFILHSNAVVHMRPSSNLIVHSSSILCSHSLYLLFTFCHPSLTVCLLLLLI